MPQASDEMQNKMFEYFGSHTSDAGPIAYLEKQGYKGTQGFTWLPKPGVTKYEDMEQKEFDCVKFLIDEWDFGGVEFDAKTD